MKCMRTPSTFSTISLMFILSGCGGGGPTFDGSSEEAAQASLAAMFPEMDFSEESDFDPSQDDMPPALETYMCATMQMFFENFGNEDFQDEVPIPTQFDGMTVADMEAYGVENDLVGCMQRLQEGIQELEELGDSFLE